jgi:hypothetical protein
MVHKLRVVVNANVQKLLVDVNGNVQKLLVDVNGNCTDAAVWNHKTNVNSSFFCVCWCFFFSANRVTNNFANLGLSVTFPKC